MAYELELPEILSAVHNVFHVSQLKKCHPEMLETPLKDTVPLEEVQLESDLTYEEKPIKILSRKGEVAYELELPEILSAVHNVFHVCQLQKCHPEMLEIPLKDTVPLEEVHLESDLTYEDKPIKILETAERVTRTKTIKFCKVQWSHHTEEEATWEREDDL